MIIASLRYSIRNILLISNSSVQLITIDTHLSSFALITTILSASRYVQRIILTGPGRSNNEVVTSYLDRNKPLPQIQEMKPHHSLVNIISLREKKTIILEAKVFNNSKSISITMECVPEKENLRRLVSFAQPNSEEDIYMLVSISIPCNSPYEYY